MDKQLIDYMESLNNTESFLDAWKIYQGELESVGITATNDISLHSDEEMAIREFLGLKISEPGQQNLEAMEISEAFNLIKQSSPKNTGDDVNSEYIQIITHIFYSVVQKFIHLKDMRLTYEQLTENEIKTIKWLVQGHTIKEIAQDKLHKSVDMVNKYINSAKNKLNARSRDQLIAKVLILGLI